MEFCEVCENMLYLTSKEEDGLMYQCKKCGNEKPANSSIVSTISFAKREQYTSIINKYTKLDPTLPRIQLKCPNEKCENHTKETDIVQIRYDNVELKYAYICPDCDTVWKSDKN